MAALDHARSITAKSKLTLQAPPKGRDLVLELDIGGLKCDARGCGWRDDEVLLEEYHEYVGATCPACQAVVLTEHDYRIVARMVRMANFLNRWLWWLPRNKSAPPSPTYAIDLDGKSASVRVIQPVSDEPADGPLEAAKGRYMRNPKSIPKGEQG